MTQRDSQGQELQSLDRGGAVNQGELGTDTAARREGEGGGGAEGIGAEKQLRQSEQKRRR